MSSCCALEQFPVEILHELFSYIPVPELYFSFFNISDHMNAVLISYPVKSIDLNSFSQLHVDFICHHIRPEKIISLTLCDDINQNGQSELFFTHFRIEQFTQLRSLTLINIDKYFLEYLFPNLNQLQHLCSFSFDTTDEYLKIDKNYRLHFNEVKSTLLKTCTRLLSQLNQLTLFNIQEISFGTASRLRHLKVSECSTIELKRIHSELPKLESFDACLQGDITHIEHLSSLSHLTRLTLAINGKESVVFRSLM